MTNDEIQQKALGATCFAVALLPIYLTTWLGLSGFWHLVDAVGYVALFLVVLYFSDRLHASLVLMPVLFEVLPVLNLLPLLPTLGIGFVAYMFLRAPPPPSKEEIERRVRLLRRRRRRRAQARP